MPSLKIKVTLAVILGPDPKTKVAVTYSYTLIDTHLFQKVMYYVYHGGLEKRFRRDSQPVNMC